MWMAQAAFGLTEHEPNNDFEHANAIACMDTISCASLEPTGDQDYFRFVGEAGDTLIALTFNCQGSNTNTVLSLFDSTEEILAVNDDSGTGYFSRIIQVLPYEGTYFLRVAEIQPFFDSSYCLTLDCHALTSAPHDLCENARVVSGIPYQDAASTSGCGNECGTDAPDVWYFFSNPAQRTLIFSVCMTNFQARVQVMGDCCDEFGGDSEEGCGDGAILTIPDMPVGDYYILVDGADAGEAGDFIFQVNGETTPCPSPTELTLATVDGYPFLFWEAATGAVLYIIWQSNDVNGTYEHIGSTADTYWSDLSGYTSTRRFYRVTAYCPW
jgi:hypothetical protein